MGRLLVPLLVVIFLAGLAWAEDPVSFADAKLKAAVEEALWLSDPTPTDMLSLVELKCVQQWGEENEGVTDLSGLEYAANLQELNLRLNWITDISVLSALTNLEVLDLSQNYVGDLSPLSGLINLRELDLHGNGISDILTLSGLVNLQTLILHENKIADVSALSGLTNLSDLDLEDNQVSDISSLLGLTSLSHLNLRMNPLTQEAYDVFIAQIIANNPGATIRHDSRVGELLSVSSTTGGSVIDPGEGEFLYDYDTVVRVEARADHGFAFASWSGTYASFENPDLIAMDRDCRLQANFVSLAPILYVDDDAAGDPGPGDASLSDPQEDGTAEHPFDSIGKAIEVAAEGVSIFVHAGTYRESIDPLGKNLHLIGMDPNDPNRTSWPVLEGAGAGPVVRFNSSEGPDCLLMGFVITQGKGPSAGAILCDGASPTIANCLIVGNRSNGSDGAAIHCQNSQAVLINCTIADNYAGPEGAALMLIDSDVTVLNSILWNDGMANEILAVGTSDPNIQYCSVRGWWSDWGNIHRDPLFARPGVWIDPDDPHQACGPENAEAILMAGDYHLKSQAGRWDPDTGKWVQDEVPSPCIDAGLPSSPVGPEPVPNGERINMGVYGGTTQASKAYPSS